MSNLLPELNLAPGQVDPHFAYYIPPLKEGDLPLRSNLSILRVALVSISGKPGQMHILRKGYDGIDYETWPQGNQEELLPGLFTHGYPKFTFPSWSLYKFWREGKTASKEQTEEMYGIGQEGWLESADKPVREFTALSAMVRYFEDKPDADHLELRTPASSTVNARIPFDAFENIVNPSRGYHPPRMGEYASLWLPKLVMDEGAAQWYETLQKQKAEEEQERADEQARRDAQQATNQAFDDIIRNFRDQGLGEAA